MKPAQAIFSAKAQREQALRLRNSMLRGLSPESYGRAIDAFDAGDLGAAAMLWDAMSRRDDVISSVKPKREKAVSRRDWQVLTVDDSAEAKRQQAVLESFWNNIEAVDALNRNDRGGVAKLIRQMMSAVSYGFASHHLVWRPSRSELSCTFEFVPLWFFENRTGELRFRPTGLEYDGVDMPRQEWMVTCGEGLMVAGGIGYVVKRSALADWMVFSEKFGIPGLLGKTSQGKDTPGGEAMQTAVETFSSDWEAVLFGADGNSTIELVKADGAAGSLPFPALIDRVDRRLAALWRGADLSSMSSGSGSEGLGASLQREEMDLIEADDALMISERLNEIDRQVLAWHFGPKVKPLAYFRLSVPQREDLKLLLEAVSKFVDLGAEIAVEDMLERFGIETPKAGAELLQRPSKAPADPMRGGAGAVDARGQAQINAERAEDVFIARAARLLARARVSDHRAMVDDLRGVLEHDDATILNALQGFIAGLPDQVGQDAAQRAAWQAMLAGALVNGLALGAGDEAQLNAFDPNQPRDKDGKWTKGASGAAGKGESAVKVDMRPATEDDRKKLGIPPAYKDAQVAAQPGADLIATAKNDQGKTVYYYSEEYIRKQQEVKFQRIAALHHDMPNLKKRMDADIAGGGADAQKAMALRVIQRTGLRNGGEDGGGKVPSYGASSLLTSHVRTEGDRVHLDFPGKKGVRQRHSFTDAEFANHVRARQKAGAERVFDHDSGGTLDYLSRISDGQYKVHDLRTWNGSVLGHAAVQKIIARDGVPANEKEFKSLQKRTAKIVSRHLGNTPAMALKAYIHPAVFEDAKPPSNKPKGKKAA